MKCIAAFVLLILGLATRYKYHTAPPPALADGLYNRRAGGLIWGFLAGRTEQTAEAEREAPVQPTSRVSRRMVQPFLPSILRRNVPTVL
jgi:hypothetical protein